MFKQLIDIKTFKAIVGNYGADYCDGDLSDSVVDDYINNHVKRKEHIFKLFGEKLKIEKEIDVAVGEYEALDLKNELINELMSFKKNLVVAAFLREVTVSETFSNSLGKDYSIFNVVLKKGMKLSKAIGKLTTPELVDSVQTKYSMFHQKLFAKGKMVLSIDPCDYVTMSSNSSGWRSCHRLDGGEYRTGPLAYLNDSSTVICYAESSRMCKFRRGGEVHSHSNKVWRQLALVSPNLDYALQERQYPNHNQLNENAVSEMFIGLFEAYNKTKYTFSNENSEILNDLHRDYAELNDEMSLYYNDIIHDMFSHGNVCYSASTTISNLINCDGELKPLKGEAAYCLDCGWGLDDSGSLYCNDCYHSDEEDDDY